MPENIAETRLAALEAKVEKIQTKLDWWTSPHWYYGGGIVLVAVLLYLNIR